MLRKLRHALIRLLSGTDSVALRIHTTSGETDDMKIVIEDCIIISPGGGQPAIQLQGVLPGGGQPAIQLQGVLPESVGKISICRNSIFRPEALPAEVATWVRGIRAA